MVISFVLHWYWVGVFAALLGLILIFVGPEERGSFGGWGYSSPGGVQIVGLLMVGAGLAFLLFGWVARMLP